MLACDTASAITVVKNNNSNNNHNNSKKKKTTTVNSDKKKTETSLFGGVLCSVCAMRVLAVNCLSEMSIDKFTKFTNSYRKWICVHWLFLDSIINYYHHGFSTHTLCFNFTLNTWKIIIVQIFFEKIVLSLFLQNSNKKNWKQNQQNQNPKNNENFYFF